MGFLQRFLGKGSNPYSVADLPVKSLYAKLQKYYDGDPYSDIQTSAYITGEWVEAMKSLRTCVHRSTEFYVSMLSKREVTISANNEATLQAIQQFLKWSNFETQKRPMIRSMALFGDLFLKVVSTKNKVYSEMIDPSYVTDFKVDYRGYVQEIRIDIPMKDENGNPYTYTEYWNKEYFSSWNHPYSDSVALDQLGTPNEFLFLPQMGVDFVPIVWIPFKRVSGKARGESCVSHALAKIDEANRITTRLHQMLWRYNKPIFVISANAVDKNNRPIPAPVIRGSTSSTERDVDSLEREVVYLPGVSTMESLIPNIDYNAALAIVKAMEDEISKDLPELHYYDMKETDASGKAMKLMLAPSIDRAEEAQSNFVAGLKRVNEIALTVGKFMGLFPGLGSYEQGDFEHTIDMGDPFPMDEGDKAALLKTLCEAGVPLSTAMKIVGYPEETINEAVEEKARASNNALSSFLTEFNKG